jgi:hypothetical protein
LSFGVVSLLAHPTSAQAPGKARRSVKVARGRVVLETFPVEGSSQLRYEISLAPCAQSGCPFQVRLIDGKQVYGTESLEWLATPGQPVKTEVDGAMGVGDPLQRKWEGFAWQVGEENQSMAVTARSVALTPQLNGVLVHHSVGLDPIKRRHYLFVAIGRKLALAWTGIEGEGPTWSTVEVSKPLPDGSQQLIFFKHFTYPTEDGAEDEPDSLEVTSYRWNAQKSEIESIPMQQSSFSIVALIAGVYDTVAEAHKARRLHSDCLGDFMFLRVDWLPQVPKGKVAIAALSTKPGLAEPVVAGCASALSIKVEKLSATR